MSFPLAVFNLFDIIMMYLEIPKNMYDFLELIHFFGVVTSFIGVEEKKVGGIGVKLPKEEILLLLLRSNTNIYDMCKYIKDNFYEQFNSTVLRLDCLFHYENYFNVQKKIRCKNFQSVNYVFFCEKKKKEINKNYLSPMHENSIMFLLENLFKKRVTLNDDIYEYIININDVTEKLLSDILNHIEHILSDKDSRYRKRRLASVVDFFEPIIKLLIVKLGSKNIKSINKLVELLFKKGIKIPNFICSWINKNYPEYPHADYIKTLVSINNREFSGMMVVTKYTSRKLSFHKKDYVKFNSSESRKRIMNDIFDLFM